MGDAYESKVKGLTMEKALAVAAYGESVAAYRYLTLAEKTTSDEHRTVFMEMAKEEQGHHQSLQGLAKTHFSGSDFVLKAVEKELVIVGPRLLDATDGSSQDRAIEQICASERLTGRFYAALCQRVELDNLAELKPFLKEMADECFEHADRLEAIPPLS